MVSGTGLEGRGGGFEPRRGRSIRGVGLRGEGPTSSISIAVASVTDIVAALVSLVLGVFMGVRTVVRIGVVVRALAGILETRRCRVSGGGARAVAMALAVSATVGGAGAGAVATVWTQKMLGAPAVIDDDVCVLW